jgi:hypothetical protein
MRSGLPPATNQLLFAFINAGIPVALSDTATAEGLQCAILKAIVADQWLDSFLKCQTVSMLSKLRKARGCLDLQRLLLI